MNTYFAANMHHKTLFIYFLILVISSVLSELNSDDDKCNSENKSSDFRTVVTKKARGRIGNHIWLLMTLTVFELKYGYQTYLAEESRRILNRFFKGFDENSPSAEKDLCGYKEFYKHYQTYLDKKITEFYEKKSGKKLNLRNPVDDPDLENRLIVPAEIGLVHKLVVDNLVNEQEFIDGFQPKKYKTENCPFEWEIFRGPRDLLDVKETKYNRALSLYPGVSDINNGEFYAHPNLAEALFEKLSFKDELVNEAQDKLHKIRRKVMKKKSAKTTNKEIIYVGIHARRTDHIAFELKHKQIPLKQTYYLDAISLFQDKFPSKKYNLVFVFVSDDMEWGQTRLGTKKAAKNVHFVGNGTEAGGPNDLALLANCNHTIQSYGSYSFYAGAFTNGLKVIPEHFKQYRLKDPQKHHGSAIIKKNPFEAPLPRLYFFDMLK